MLFDLRPKERLNDLFGRRAEYEELSRLVKSGQWVAVLGRRMTGKTSLVKTFATETGGDLREPNGSEGARRPSPSPQPVARSRA